MSIYAFGDIHGEVFKLKSLVDRVFPEKDAKLIFLGDYIDRGSFSYEVIEYLLELDSKYDCVFLMGNHERMLIDYMSGIYEKIFTANGGQKTITNYELHGWDLNRYTYYKDRTMPGSHRAFLKQLKKYYETDEFIFVHAGIQPNTPLKNTPDDILLWDTGFRELSHYKGKVVVYGHCPNKKPINEKYKIGIDTGACFDDMGDLTCVKLPEREFIKQGWVLEYT